MKTVSILVPVYQVEKYIEECAESLFAQTYPSIEYIFCDDCSTDRSIEILQKVIDRNTYRKDKVTILRNEKNVGLGATRVNLVNAVKTDCFFIADSDDVLPRYAIETLVKQMQKSDTDYVEGAYCVYSDGELSPVMTPPHCHDDEYMRKVLSSNHINHHVWGRLFRTSILEKLPDLFIEGVDFAEDFCAITRLAAVATRSWTDEVVYHYRVEHQSFFISQLTEKKMKSYMKAYANVLSFYHQRGHLPMALELGILYLYRKCHFDSGMTIEMIDENLKYVPEHASARMLYNLFHSKSVPFGVTDTIYRIVRMFNK